MEQFYYRMLEFALMVGLTGIGRLRCYNKW